MHLVNQHHIITVMSPEYINAIELIKDNAFNIRSVPIDIIDERLLRFVRKQHAWAIDAWMVDLPKDQKKYIQTQFPNVWVDVIRREYEDL